MIEPKIYQSLLRSSIAETLARYEERPAVFYQLAPHDGATGWQSAVQYPRLDYGIDWRANAERKTSGTLLINIWCLNESGVAPEDLAQVLIDELSETFYSDDSGTYCLVWTTANSYEGTGDKEPKKVGVSVFFDVLAFPKQTTHTEPDPVEGLNRFLKEICPDCYLIGYEALPETFKATDEKPALYVRLANNRTDMKSGFAVTWYDCALEVHLIAPDPNKRGEMLQKIIHISGMRHECILADNSPLLFNQLTVNYSVNPLHEGQLTMQCRYGVLTVNPDDDAPMLNHVNCVQKVVITHDNEKNERTSNGRCGTTRY